MNKLNDAGGIDMKNSVIYRSLCESVRKQDHKELLRMLEIAAADRASGNAFDPNDYSLIRAFSWRNTPQGYEYWQELSNRLYEAGHVNY